MTMEVGERILIRAEVESGYPLLDNSVAIIISSSCSTSEKSQNTWSSDVADIAYDDDVVMLWKKVGLL
jgi:hypothetical protein